MLDDCAVDLVVDAPDSTLEPAACESTLDITESLVAAVLPEERTLFLERQSR